MTNHIFNVSEIEIIPIIILICYRNQQMKSTLCLALGSFFLSYKTTLLNILLTKLPLSRLRQPGRLIYTGSTLVTMNIQPRKPSVAKLCRLVTYREYQVYLVIQKVSYYCMLRLFSITNIKFRTTRKLLFSTTVLMWISNFVYHI